MYIYIYILTYKQHHINKTLPRCQCILCMDSVRNDNVITTSQSWWIHNAYYIYSIIRWNPFVRGIQRRICAVGNRSAVCARVAGTRTQPRINRRLVGKPQARGEGRSNDGHHRDIMAACDARVRDPGRPLSQSGGVHRRKQYYTQHERLFSRPIIYCHISAYIAVESFKTSFQNTRYCVSSHTT